MDQERMELQFVTAEDRTGIGYNTSMNFWYVGGEVAFETAEMTLPTAASLILQVEAKSPVTDAVPLVARIRQGETVTQVTGDVLAKQQGNEVRLDLSAFSGQTVVIELAYVWEQSSLIPIKVEIPGTQLLMGTQAPTVSESETDEEPLQSSEEGTEESSSLEGTEESSEVAESEIQTESGLEPFFGENPLRAYSLVLSLVICIICLFLCIFMHIDRKRR